MRSSRSLKPAHNHEPNVDVRVHLHAYSVQAFYIRKS